MREQWNEEIINLEKVGRTRGHIFCKQLQGKTCTAWTVSNSHKYRAIAKIYTTRL
jgi:hypothetical protein